MIRCARDRGESDFCPKAFSYRRKGKMGKTMSFTLIVIIALGAISCCSKMEAKMSNQGTGFSQGSPCTYASYEGSAEIVRVTQTPASMAQSSVIGGPGYEGYEVWFRFVPNRDVRHRGIRSLIGREHLFTLDNGWYIGPRYQEEYDIKIGKTYPCVLKVIKEGTCSPVVFEFKTINSKDYFESRP